MITGRVVAGTQCAFATAILPSPRRTGRYPDMKAAQISASAPGLAQLGARILPTLMSSVLGCRQFWRIFCTAHRHVRQRTPTA
jgi:hypothetical protein